jgi:hypothetical protein
MKKKLRKSNLYETIIKELIRLNNLEVYFDKKVLEKLVKRHPKYMVFVYKHSDLKNKDKMTLYFNRKAGIKPIKFMVDMNIYKEYFKV